MGMNIKNEQVQRLAKQLAAETGETMTSVIQHALEEKLERLRKDKDVAERIRRIDDILARSGPTPPGLTSDHSDLYDEWGMPK